MKYIKIIITCFLFILFSGAAYCSDNAEVLYKENKFNEALASYQEMLKTDGNNPFLYYNIGNTYYRLNNRGQAILNYYRAYNLLPRNGDIRHNLSLALIPTGHTLVPAEVPVVVHKMFFWFSVKELLGLLYVSLGLFLISLIVLMKIRSPFVLNNARRLLIISCILTLFTGAWYFTRGAMMGKKGIVLLNMGEVRGGPGDNFSASATVPEGYLIKIINETSQWYEIEIPGENIKGWIKQDAVGVI